MSKVETMLSNMISNIKIAKEGYILILVFALITVVLLFISSILGFIGVILTAWCIYFFRDPDRITPQSDDLIIAPADGKVIKVEKCIPPKELRIEEEMLKISIFMNVFNVHVNRIPCSGTVKDIVYKPGTFFNVALDKGSLNNERQSFIMETNKGKNVIFVQIAGLIARRIVKFINEDETVEAGQKFGLIKFGSRVDIYLPNDVVPSVFIGQTTIGGETVIANLNNKDNTVTTKILNRNIIANNVEDVLSVDEKENTKNDIEDNIDTTKNI